MESTQCQYRLIPKKNKPFRTEKRTTTFTYSKKPKGQQVESQQPPKTSQVYSQKPVKKLKEHAKYQNHDQKTVYSPVHKGSESQNNREFYPSYQYCPQYYMPALIGYPEFFVPVYGYRIKAQEPSYEKKGAAGDNSPQDVGNSGCPTTVASEEDLNNLAGEECEFKVVCNGNVIHKENFSEQESDPNAQSVISLSDYEEFVLPFTGLEPKSDAIPLPSFLA